MKLNAMPHTSETNWDRIDAFADADIDTSDCPPLGEEFFEKATLRPARIATVRMVIEPEVLAWFQSQSEQYEQLMSEVLRAYAAAHCPVPSVP